MSGRDFDYVNILEAKGPLLPKEIKRMRKVKSPYLNLDDLAERQELTKAMPKSCLGGFLPVGLWVLEGLLEVTGDRDHKGNDGIPRVCFKDGQEGRLHWRRPRDRDNWPKRLHCVGGL